MSYLHCPTCQRAFNLATQSTCPFCPVAATVVDASADIVLAAEQLARAVARATPSQRDAALARMDHLALPPGGASDDDFAPGARHAEGSGPTRMPGAGQATLRQIRAALAPPALPPVPPAPPKPLLVQVALAVLTRLESRPRLRRATDLIRSRVRALAA